MSAFGVDLGYVSKAMPFRRPKLKPKSPVADLKFKKINPSQPSGPGSQRAKLSQSAWESQTAARRRGQ